MDEFERFASRVADLRSGATAADRVLVEVEEQFRGLLRPELLPDELRSAERTTSARYLLHRSDAVTIFAMASVPGAVSDIHDHGAWGLVGQVLGEEIEHVYRAVPSGDRRFTLERVSTRRLKPGDITAIDPPHRDVHQVVNAGPGSSVSLHAFAHDLVHRGFTVFRPAVYGSEVYSGHWDNEAAEE